MDRDLNLAAVILAAGKGTRMKSKRPKVMHCLLGRPLLDHVMTVLEQAGISRHNQVVVAGHGRDVVEKHISSMEVTFVYQHRQLGTGHAVLCARRRFHDFDGNIMIICGDTPLFLPETIQRFIAAHVENKNDVSILSAEFQDPSGYGRIVRLPDGAVQAIIEQKDADQSVRRITEVNTGTYLARSDILFTLLERVDCNNAQGEYYLTDIVQLGIRDGLNVGAFPLAAEEEALGVNSRAQLARAEAILLDRIRLAHMEAGITLIMPETIYIEPDVVIGPDTVIWSNVLLKGKTCIGESSIIHAFSCLENFSCGPGTVVEPFSLRVGEGAMDSICS